jgi:arylsulfatase A-like enzyme
LPQLAALAAASGTRTVLLTDTPAVAESSFGRAFAEHLLLPLPAAEVAADDVAETGLAQIFQAATDVLSQLTPPFLLWIHVHGMAGPWDAPLDLRNQFADEDDPTPPTFVTPPDLVLPTDFDPDELLGFSHAYAGQVSLLDLCLGTFLDELDAQPWSGDSLLAVTSPRGYPLGQHQRVGTSDERLYSELLHVPLMLRMPGGATTLQRRQSLVQPAYLYATLLDACGWHSATPNSLLRMLASDDDASRQLAFAIGHHERAIRTPAWWLRETLVDERLHHELYVKPDDYWEVNEIANRAGDIVQLLAAELDRRHLAALQGTAQPAPLAEPLRNIWR